LRSITSGETAGTHGGYKYKFDDISIVNVKPK